MFFNRLKIENHDEEIRIVWHWLSVYTILFAFGAVIWNGSAIKIIPVFYDLFPAVLAFSFSGLYLLVGLFVIYKTLVHLLNKTEITIDAHFLYITTQPFAVKHGNQQFSRSMIQDVKVQRYATIDSESTAYSYEVQILHSGEHYYPLLPVMYSQKHAHQVCALLKRCMEIE